MISSGLFWRRFCAQYSGWFKLSYPPQTLLMTGNYNDCGKSIGCFIFVFAHFANILMTPCLRNIQPEVHEVHIFQKQEVKCIVLCLNSLHSSAASWILHGCLSNVI